MNRNKTKIGKLLLGGVIAAGLSTVAHAQLNSTYTFNGQGDWSIDGVGGAGDPVGDVRADVPVGSTIVKAYLYSSQYIISTPDVSLNGQEYSGASWTPLGVNEGFLEAWRTDVTSQMTTTIGGGSATQFSFPVVENANNAGTDGEVLAIIFSNPSDPTRTIAFLDGAAASTGSTTTINYASPLTGVGAGFTEEMSIGDGFGFQLPNQDTGQQSVITVNGRTLTSSAGGQDDGDGTGNGSLITVGGIGDSTANPDPTTSSDTPLGDRTDDELYDLGQGNDQNTSAFVSNGDTSTTIDTFNSSDNDLIFFLGLNLSAEATVRGSTPDSASTVSLLGLAMSGLVAYRRKMGKA